MKTGLIVLNFGEPENPSREEVVAFLERIFSGNASLEGNPTPEQIQRRSRELAEARAPALIEEYVGIGGSPLNRQAQRQVDLLEEELRARGHDLRAYSAMQYTDPTIPDIVTRAHEDGMERLVALPVYPLCGRSTTVAALETLTSEVAKTDWGIEVLEISGWHRHPEYVRLHADNISGFMTARGLRFDDPNTRLVFSAHGTPIKYLDEGNRYDRYVDDFCGSLAGQLGVESYELGFQNHGNRPIEWTQPDIEEVIEGLGGKIAVVVAVSFMHEQSETLSELDIELKGEAEEAGVEFHRVPVPFEEPRFIRALADVVEARLALSEDDSNGEVALRPCLCRNTESTFCLNGAPFSETVVDVAAS